MAQFCAVENVFKASAVCFTSGSPLSIQHALTITVLALNCEIVIGSTYNKLETDIVHYLILHCHTAVSTMKSLVLEC